MADGPDLDYRKMYQRTSSMAKIGVWAYDLVEQQLTWTDAVYDLFELPRDTPLTREATLRCYDPRSRQEMEHLRADAIATGGSFDLDINIRTFRGNARWIHLTADVEQENGKSVRIFGTKQDITDRKRAQDQVRLLQAELIQTSRRDAMGTMAATLAHELNQPLAAIANYTRGVDRLLEGQDIPPSAVQGLRQIEATALRAGEIIRKVRLMIERGRIQAKAFDLTGILSDAAANACFDADGTPYQLDFQHSNLVLADPTQMYQVATNLIRNACEAMEEIEDRKVTVATRDDGEWVTTCVSDNGPGVPDHVSLFSATNSTKADGMGIGLAICRTMVEAAGGSIWLAEREFGPTFCFNLPKAPTNRRPQPSSL